MAPRGRHACAIRKQNCEPPFARATGKCVGLDSSGLNRVRTGGDSMCDDHTEQDNEEAFDAGRLSRRGFSVMSLAALAACTTAPAEPGNRGRARSRDHDARWRDRRALRRAASGKWPAVLVWPDIMGLRPAFRLMAQPPGESGYAVLTVNPFYRLAEGPGVRRDDREILRPAGSSASCRADGPDGQQSGEHKEGRDCRGRLARQAEGSRHLERHWHDRILHGRSAGDAHDGVRAGSREGRRQLPWRRPVRHRARRPARTCWCRR